jgi:YHS domain-containing protein
VIERKEFPTTSFFVFIPLTDGFVAALLRERGGGIVMSGKTFVNKLLFACALLSLSGVLAGRTYAQQQPVDALEGLDPVMLAQGKEAQGEVNITVTRGQFRYMFANAANKAAFEQDPARYEIQLGGACARMGAPVQGNADLYAVHKGRIYIFGSDNCKTLFVAAPEKYLGPGEAESAPAPSTPEALERGQALIGKAVAAMGGAARIDGLTSYREKSVAPQIRGASGEIEVKVNLDLLIAFPDRIRFALSMPDYNDPSVTIQPVSVISQKEAFVITPSGVRPAPDAARADQERQIQRKPLSILRARNSAGFKAAAAGQAKAGETAVEKVTVELRGERYTLGIDPVMGRILSLSYKRRGPQGILGELVQTFSDFRSVDGLTLPFKVDASFDGQPWKNQSSTVDTIVINGAIDPALFEKPKQGQ